MSLLNMEQIEKAFGEKIIFKDASFGIHERDKIGIVGLNGSGKTTLLRMAAGLEEPDGGQVVRQNGLRVAYLPQHPSFGEGATIASYGLSGDADRDWRVQAYFNELGVSEPGDTLIKRLSGGVQRKVAMAKLLASDFDLLLLDEPTNHLDRAMVEWLEGYLRSFKGAILMVTHDRYFLDKVTNRILEISHGSLYGYETDYTGFLERKAEREEMELASERKRQSLLRIEMEWAKRGCRARTTKQRARLLRLEELKKKEKPVKDSLVELDSLEARMGKKTIELRHVGKSFGEKKILEDYSYIALKNQRLGIIGPNGCGKSTFMKLLAGLEQPDTGEIQVGETVKVGYFAQEEQEMDESLRVIDYVKDIGEYIGTKEGKLSATQLLERFLFPPSMQYAPIGRLSGGEKRRLYLLGVLAQNANLLLLDEPGNNLDIPTLTILEDYLNAFPGIVIAVSHDRYFLDNVADRILELDGKGHISQYEGGYTDYLAAKQAEQKAWEKAGKAPGRPSQGAAEKGGKSKDWRQGRPAKRKFTFKEQKDYESIDGDIAALEAEIGELDAAMLENATNSAKLSQLMAEKEEKERELEEKMERWVYLNDLAEQIEAERQNRG